MPIKQYHIDELKVIYKKQCGIELADQEAWDMASHLVNLFRILIEEPNVDNNPADDK